MKIKDLLSENFEDDFEVDYDNTDETVPKDLGDFEEDSDEQRRPTRDTSDDAHSDYANVRGSDRYMSAYSELSDEAKQLLLRNEKLDTMSYDAPTEELVDAGLVDDVGDLSMLGKGVRHLVKKARDKKKAQR
jgi:hypothetical protein